MAYLNINTSVSSSDNDKSLAGENCHTWSGPARCKTHVHTPSSHVPATSSLLPSVQVREAAYPLQPKIKTGGSLATEKPLQGPADKSDHGKSTEEDASSLVRATNAAVKQNVISHWAPNTHQILIMATLSLVSLMVALDACIIVTCLNVGALAPFARPLLIFQVHHP